MSLYKIGEKVTVPSRLAEPAVEVGYIESIERRLDNKTEYHIKLDSGGRTTATEEQIGRLV